MFETLLVFVAAAQRCARLNRWPMPGRLSGHNAGAIRVLLVGDTMTMFRCGGLLLTLVMISTCRAVRSADRNVQVNCA